MGAVLGIVSILVLPSTAWAETSASGITGSASCGYATGVASIASDCVYGVPNANAVTFSVDVDALPDANLEFLYYSNGSFANLSQGPWEAGDVPATNVFPFAGEYDIYVKTYEEDWSGGQVSTSPVARLRLAGPEAPVTEPDPGWGLDGTGEEPPPESDCSALTTGRGFSTSNAVWRDGKISLSFRWGGKVPRLGWKIYAVGDDAPPVVPDPSTKIGSVSQHPISDGWYGVSNLDAPEPVLSIRIIPTGSDGTCFLQRTLAGVSDVDEDGSPDTPDDVDQAVNPDTGENCGKLDLWCGIKWLFIPPDGWLDTATQNVPSDWSERFPMGIAQVVVNVSNAVNDTQTLYTSVDCTPREGAEWTDGTNSCDGQLLPSIDASQLCEDCRTLEFIPQDGSAARLLYLMRPIVTSALVLAAWLPFAMWWAKRWIKKNAM